MTAGTDDGPGERPATVGVPRETVPGERRVALVPAVVGRLRSRGVTVVVEPGAGLGALIPDEQYTAAGAVLGDPWTADAVLVVTPPVFFGGILGVEPYEAPRCLTGRRPAFEDVVFSVHLDGGRDPGAPGR